MANRPSYPRAEDDTAGPKTPIASSGAFPVYRNACNEAIVECNRLGSVTAGRLKAEFERLLSVIESWTPKTPPTDIKRDEVLHDLTRHLDRLHVYRARIER